MKTLILCSCHFVFQGRSSEVIIDDVRDIKSQIEESFCAQTMTFGLKGCIEVFSASADFLGDAALYKLIGRHSVAAVVKAGKNYSAHHVVTLKYCTVQYTLFREET